MLPQVATHSYSPVRTGTIKQTFSRSITRSDKKSKTTILSENTSINVNTYSYTYSGTRLNALRKNSLSLLQPEVPQKEEDKGRLTVVLDVDETLIHSRLTPSQDRFRQSEERKVNTQCCEEFQITLEDGETIWVNKRPGLDGFLKATAERYEIIAYTAALEEYAKPLLDWLDPEGKIFRHRFYRDSCLFVRGYYVKDLEKMNRCLKRTVLVDNNAFCFLPQLSNGIPISSFYDDPTDNALSVLMAFLERLEKEQDVRPILNKSFNLQKLLKEHRDHIIG